MLVYAAYLHARRGSRGRDGASRRTQAFSETLVILGAKGEAGVVPPFTGGCPSPLIPLTLRLCTLGTAVGGGRGVGGADWASFASWRSNDGSEMLLTDGGVIDPEVGVAPLPPASLELSVECSVRKLARDRRLSSLKLKRDEGMGTAGVVSPG